MKFWRFTDSDWHGYAGAERFGDKTDPYIAEGFDKGEDWILIIDGNGAELSTSFDQWTTEHRYYRPHVEDAMGTNSALANLAMIALQFLDQEQILTIEAIAFILNLETIE